VTAVAIERVHGIAGGFVRFGAATWFQDVLVRFGYHLPEHEHPWDGEWFDDTFEAAALDLRATGAKLLRSISVLGGHLPVTPDDAESAALSIDAVVAYMQRLMRGVVEALPCCYGADGRQLIAARCGGPLAMAEALSFLDPQTAELLIPPPDLMAVVDLGFTTHCIELFSVIDAAGDRPPLPRLLAAARGRSAVVSASAIDCVDRALAAMCPWFDALLGSLQMAVAARADDGDDLSRRWANPSWSVLARSSEALGAHLPAIC
jgi:hypothetical protein